MAIRAVGRGGRAWSDALLGRPWLLVAAVALLIAMPVLVLGQTSENDTRARLAAAQVESAAHAAEVVSSNFHDRTVLIGDVLAALAVEPTPDASPIGLAVQRGDVATLQAVADSVQRLYLHNLLRVYIGVRGRAGTIDGATIVAASPGGTSLIGRRLSDPTVGAGTIPELLSRGEGLGFSDAYPGSVDAPSRVVLSADVLATGVAADPRFHVDLSSAEILAEVDLARTFAEFAAPFLASGDDAYLLNGRRQLLGRAGGPTEFPLRDLSGDPFVQLVVARPIVRLDAIDPLSGGTRLIASARMSGSDVSGSDWQILVLRDTTAVDREIDAVLGQLAAARYVLVALLLVGAVLVAQAASAQIRQRQALAAANDRIEAASLHKSAFLSSMSHELRTPLNSINGFSDVLLTGIGGTLTEKQREYLTDIRGSGEHLLALVNDVLDLSKVEAGKMELQPMEFDLREAVEAVHRVVAPLAQQKGQKLELEIDEVGTVRLDQGRLRQILLNVLSNAVKYTPDGGTVTTAVQRQGVSIEITIRDSGVGIAAPDQARVFDDFTRIESGYARTQQGTGLGLSLARRLVRLMGGDITLDSEPGRGSTFTITVPTA
ncbi:MAG: HAMP domain-containing histidine kinase [Chloroflexota bacterium]|nr:HAMP domain-containing histidine kinase [Chloroflexota bacterium]